MSKIETGRKFPGRSLVVGLCGALSFWGKPEALAGAAMPPANESAITTEGVEKNVQTLSLQEIAQGAIDNSWIPTSLTQKPKGMTPTYVAVTELQVQLRVLFAKDIRPDGQPGVLTADAIQSVRKRFGLPAPSRVVLDQDLAQFVCNLRDRPDKNVERLTLEQFLGQHGNPLVFKYRGDTRQMVSSDIVLLASTLLEKQGYDCGGASRKLGPKITKALIAYQRDRTSTLQKELGVLSPETLHALQEGRTSDAQDFLSMEINSNAEWFKSLPEVCRVRISESLSGINHASLQTLSTLVSTPYFRGADSGTRGQLAMLAFDLPPTSQQRLIYMAEVLSIEGTSFEKRQFEQTDLKGRRLVDALTRLVSSKYRPEVEAERESFIDSVVQEAILIELDNRQDGGSCLAAQIYRHYFPAERIRMVVDMLSADSSGEVVLAGGTKLKLDPLSLSPAARKVSEFDTDQKLSMTRSVLLCAWMNAVSPEGQHWDPIRDIRVLANGSPSDYVGMDVEITAKLLFTYDGTPYVYEKIPPGSFSSLEDFRTQMGDCNAILILNWPAEETKADGTKVWGNGSHAVNYLPELYRSIDDPQIRDLVHDCVLIGNSHSDRGLAIGSTLGMRGKRDAVTPNANNGGPFRVVVDAHTEGLGLSDLQDNMLGILRPKH